MTDEQARALGLRAKDCAGWQWLPGMWVWYQCPSIRGMPDDRWYGQRLDGEQGSLYKESDRFLEDMAIDGEPVHNLWPDLRDPATLGCLPHLMEPRRGWYWLAPEHHAGPCKWAVWWWDAPTVPVIVASSIFPAESWVLAMEWSP